MDDYVRDYGDTLWTSLKKSSAFEVLGATLIAVGVTGVEVDTASKFFSVIPERVADEMFAAKLPSGHTLSQRIWNLNYSRDIITIVENGVANHVPAEVLSKQLDGFILPGRHVTTTTPYGRALNFDSMRLARTEIGHAYRHATFESAKRAPWVTGVTWHLSLEHPDLACECENMDGQVYAPEDEPDDPHPQCLCYTTENVMRGSEWDEVFNEYQETGIDNYGIREWMEAV